MHVKRDPSAQAGSANSGKVGPNGRRAQRKRSPHRNADAAEAAPNVDMCLGAIGGLSIRNEREATVLKESFFPLKWHECGRYLQI